jgi:hypothetical protein
MRYQFKEAVPSLKLQARRETNSCYSYIYTRFYMYAAKMPSNIFSLVYDKYQL